MGRTKKLLCAVAVCATAVVGVGASAAYAGEVIGPPGTPGVPDSGSGVPTEAPDHASSICSFSGLNDMTLGEGPIDSIVQTPHDGPPGIPGLACRGGSN
jgi:hypothetical protein